MISISDKEPCKRQRVGEKFPKALAAPAWNQFRNHVALRTYTSKLIFCDNKNNCIIDYLKPGNTFCN